MSITNNLECLFKTSNYSKKKKKVKKKSEKSLRPSNYLSILIPLNTNQNIKHIKQKSARNWTLQNNLRTYRVNAWFSLDSIVPGQWQSRRAWLFVTPWTAACQAPLFFIISWHLLRFISIELVMLSNHLILCWSLLLPSIFPSITVFSNESALQISWPKYWSFSFSISPSNEYSGLISFRIDCFVILDVQGTLKSLFQHYSWKHKIFRTKLSLRSKSHICTWLLEKP